MIHLVLDRVLVLVLRLRRPRRWVVVHTRLGIRDRRLDRRDKAAMGAGHRGGLDNPCSGVIVVVIVVGAETWFFFSFFFCRGVERWYVCGDLLVVVYICIYRCIHGYGVLWNEFGCCRFGRNEEYVEEEVGIQTEVEEKEKRDPLV